MTTKTKTARQKQLERRPMKRTKKGKRSGLVKATTDDRRAKRANMPGARAHSTTQANKIGADNQAIESEPKQVNGKVANGSSMLGKSVETTRLAIARLLVAGVEDISVVANTLGLGQKHVAKEIKALQLSINKVTMTQYKSSINSKLAQLLHNHTSSSATLAVELHKLDTHIHNIDSMLHGSIVNDIDDSTKSLRTKRDKLASKRLALLVAQRDNNAILFSTLSKVGVSEIALDKKKEVSIPVTTNNKITKSITTYNPATTSGLPFKGDGAEDGFEVPTLEVSNSSSVLDLSSYSEMDRDVALAELKRSTRQMDRYLVKQKKEAELKEKGGQVVK